MFRCMEVIFNFHILIQFQFRLQSARIAISCCMQYFLSSKLQTVRKTLRMGHVWRRFPSSLFLSFLHFDFFLVFLLIHFTFFFTLIFSLFCFYIFIHSFVHLSLFSSVRLLLFLFLVIFLRSKQENVH